MNKRFSLLTFVISILMISQDVTAQFNAPKTAAKPVIEELHGRKMTDKLSMAGRQGR